MLRTLLAPVIAVSFILSASSGLAQPADENDSAIIRAIEDLKSPKYDVRQKASQALAAAGDDAVKAIALAAETDDLETAARCAELLARCMVQKKSKKAREALERLAKTETLRVSSRARSILADLNTSKQDWAIAALEAQGVRIGRHPNTNEVYWVYIQKDLHARYLPYLKSLQMVQLMGRDVTDACLEFLEHADQVTSVMITDTSITSAGLEKLKSMKRLSQVSLMQQPFTGAGLRPLQEIAALRSINLRGCPIDSDFSFLDKLPNLVSVSLAELEFGTSEIDSLNKLKKLQMLQLSISKGDDSQLEAVGRLRTQVYLQVSSSPNITTNGWRHLSESRLIGLYVSSTPIKDDDLEPIGKIVTLRTLGVYRADITDAGLKHLKNLKSLSSINLRNTKVTDAALDKLKKSLPYFNRKRVAPIAGLKKINISTHPDTGRQSAHIRGQIDADTIKELKKIKNLDGVYLSRETKDKGIALLKDVALRGLIVNSKHVTDAGVKSLETHPTLQSLSIWSSSITDKALVSVAKIPSLDYLTLQRQTSITDEGVRTLIADLRKPAKIKSLSIVSSSQITDAAFADLDKLLSLEQLFLSNNPQLTSSLLENIAKLKNITRLEINDLALDEKDLAHLLALPKLETLGLSYSSKESSLTDSGMEVLSQLASLKSLTIQKAKITDLGAARLTQLKSLERLYLSETGVTDATLAKLADQLPRLERLGLRGTKVTNEGMKHVGKLTNLQWIWLDKTEVGSDGVPHLKPLKKLKRVYLDLSKVNAAAHRQLIKDHPNAQIQLQ